MDNSLLLGAVACMPAEAGERTHEKDSAVMMLTLPLDRRQHAIVGKRDAMWEALRDRGLYDHHLG